MLEKTQLVFFLKMINQLKNKIKKFVNKYLPLRVSFLRRGYGAENDRFSYQNKYINFNIKKNDKVLDIGSGGYPFPLATHLADFYEGKTTHRADKLIKDDRPFTNCNIENAPFEDEEFDFVYCSHVLEHLDDPAKACEELMRIAKRGYIETPAKSSDIMFNFTKILNHHRWHTQVLENTLIFIEWKDSERRELGTNYFFEQFHSNWKNPFQELMYSNRDLFVSMLIWEKRFDYIVISKNGEIINTNKK